jgi:hypothetical protein
MKHTLETLCCCCFRLSTSAYWGLCEFRRLFQPACAKYCVLSTSLTSHLGLGVGPFIGFCVNLAYYDTGLSSGMQIQGWYLPSPSCAAGLLKRIIVSDHLTGWTSIFRVRLTWKRKV